MKIELAQQIGVLSSVMKSIMDLLADELPEGDDELTGDEILDFFALAIATVIDNDSNLTTPRHLRLAAEVAQKRIERHVKALKTMNDGAGISLLSAILSDSVPTAH